MSVSVKLVALSGSTRKNSLNKQLVRLALKEGKQYAQVTVIYKDLADFSLPLYDADHESQNAYPNNAAELKQVFIESNGILIASPEYNSSVTGVLKNTLDWLSRSFEHGTDLRAFNGKVMAIVSASPGPLGGLRGLVHLRAILTNMGAVVVPAQLALPGAMRAFDEEGQLVDPFYKEKFQGVFKSLVETAQRYKIKL